MKQDEIIELARQAGMALENYGGTLLVRHLPSDSLEVFAKLVAAKEREDCVRRAHIALLGTLESTAGRVIHAIQTRGEA